MGQFCIAADTRHRESESLRREQERQRLLREQTNSFEVVARDWHRNRREVMAKWTELHADRIMRTLENDVFPVLGAVPIVEVSAPMVLDVINAVVSRGSVETAKKINQWVNAIFRYAVTRKLVPHNEAANIRDELPTAARRHNPHLTAAEIPAFIRAVEESDQTGEVVRIAILFTLHTLARTGETRFAKWAEFDFDAALWSIPAERMKMKQPHVVPLSDQVLALLKALRPFTGHYDYLFVTRGFNRPVSENGMLYALYRLGYRGRLTIHGLRGTGSTVLNEAGFRAEVIETALAHKDRNAIRAAYNHADYLEERRAMLQWWSDYLTSTGQGADVVPIRRGSG